MAISSRSLRSEFLDLIGDFFDERTQQNAPSTSETWGPVAYHVLSTRVDAFVTQARSEHRNPRVELLPIDSDSQDLLECHETSDKLDMPNLSDLLAEVTRHEPNLPNQVAIAAVALTGGHCARLDSNAAAAAHIWDWSDHKSPTEWHPRRCAPLRAVYYLGEVAKAARPHGGLNFMETFKEIASESREQLKLENTPADCATADLQQHQSVLGYLTEALALLPVKLLQAQVLNDEWFRKSLPNWFSGRISYAEFHQHYARILLALGDLKQAREEVTHALTCAQPHMLQTIEACRQMQLTIDLEELSRKDITETVTSKVTQMATDEIETVSTDLQSELLDEIKTVSTDLQSELLGAISKRAEDERKRTTADINSTLLRVIELLGVFLAVIGIAVTSVGGIAVEGSTGDKFVIWGSGFGSIVVLFGLLRLIIYWTPRGFRGKGESTGTNGEEN